jgi:putative mycofactocin binding protein MftB
MAGGGELTSAVVQVDLPYQLHPSVAVRPEPFGALVYHYGNRKLVFLKSPRIVAVVRSLAEHPSIDAVLAAHDVSESARPKYLAALESLLRSEMIVPAVASLTPVEVS